MVYSQSPGGLARVILVLVLTATLTGALVASAQAGEYSQFYSGLVKGISKAQGTATVSLVKGNWTTEYDQSQLNWHIGAGATMDVTYTYEAGELVNATVRFVPTTAVRVEMTQGSVRTGRVLDWIKYQAHGDVRDKNWIIPGPPWNSDKLEDRVLRHLLFAQTPDSLFLGKPFRSLASMERPPSMISQVQFKPAMGSDGTPSTAVLKDDADVTLPGGDRLKTMSPESMFDYNDLSYYPPSDQAGGILKGLKLKLYTGRLHAGGQPNGQPQTLLLLRPDSSLEFDRIKFNRDSKRIDLLSGKLEADLKANSRLSLAVSGGKEAYLVASDVRGNQWSHISTKTLQIAINDGTSGTLGFQDGTVQLNIASGRLVFGGGNYIVLGNGKATLDLGECWWGAGGRPLVTGSIRGFSATVQPLASDPANGAGELHLNKKTNFLLARGDVEAEELDLATNEDYAITGKLSKAHMFLGAGSRLNIPNLALTASNLGRISPTCSQIRDRTQCPAESESSKVDTISKDTSEIEASTANPLVFRMSDPNPDGTLQIIDMPIKEGDVELGKQGTVHLLGGRIVATINMTDEAIGGKLSLDVTAGKGRLQIGPGTTLNLASGRIVANDMSLDENVGVTGSFSTVELVFDESTIGIPGGVVINTKKGGTVSASDREAPLTIDRNGETIYGNIRVTTDFSGFWSSSPAQLSLSDGHIDLPLQCLQNGSINGHDIAVSSGHLAFSSTDELGKPVTVEGSVNISGGTLRKPVNDVPEFNATWNMTIDSLHLERTVPGSSKSEPETHAAIRFTNQYLLPVHLVIGLSAPVKFPDRPIKFLGDVVTTESAATASLTITIPEGGGEYLDPSDPSKGTSDTMRPKQEVWRVDMRPEGATLINAGLEPEFRPSSRPITALTNPAWCTIGNLAAFPDGAGLQLAVYQEPTSILAVGFGFNPIGAIADGIGAAASAAATAGKAVVNAAGKVVETVAGPVEKFWNTVSPYIPRLITVGCTLHVYLDPQTVPASVDISLKADKEHGFVFEASNLQKQGDIRTDTDGCRFAAVANLLTSGLSVPTPLSTLGEIRDATILVAMQRIVELVANRLVRDKLGGLKLVPKKQ